MSVQLNHIIVPAKEKWTSARFLAAILNLEVGSQWGPFVPLRTSNGVTIDFVDAMDFEPHHCAFLITEGNSKPHSPACASVPSRSTRTSCVKRSVSSIISMAAGAFTSTTRPATCLS
jgi:hypothetical protein